MNSGATGPPLWALGAEAMVVVGPSMVRVCSVSSAFLGGMAMSVSPDTHARWSVCEPCVTSRWARPVPSPSKCAEPPTLVDCTQGPGVLPGPSMAGPGMWAQMLCVLEHSLEAVCPEKG